MKKSQKLKKKSVEKKPPGRILQILHVYSTPRKHEHYIFISSPRRFNTEHTQCNYEAKTIVKRHKESLLQRVFQKFQLQK